MDIFLPLLVRENPVKPEFELPQVVKMFPADNAQRVPTNIREIFVEFNTDMSSTICLNLFEEKQKELLFSNAYWQSDRILAIKVAGSLKPHTRYSISLGFPKVCQLMDNFGGLLPLTRWSFTTE